MRRKYFASIVAVAMLAAGVPCAQAEELDANTAQTTDSQIVQNETQNNGSSNEAAESALNASADNQIAGRTVENIDKGWTFSKNDASMEGWTFPTGASRGLSICHIHGITRTLRCRISLRTIGKPLRTASNWMLPSTTERTYSSSSMARTRTLR